VPAESTFAMYF